MTPKEVKAVIAANSGKPLYQVIGSGSNSPVGFQLHQKVSRTHVIRLAKHYHSFRVQKFKDERPDLYERYGSRPNSSLYMNWEEEIVTFDATKKGAERVFGARQGGARHGKARHGEARLGSAR